MNLIQELQILSKGYSILYVEDNKALRENAKKLLSKFFSKVDIAEDGQIGLEKFKKYHYSIVITDIKMPVMDGITLIKHLKYIAPETKVIIMSAFDDKPLLFKGIELGIFRFLKKPVNISELSEVLYKALKEIKHETNTRLFYSSLKSVFEYQSSMVIMLHDTKVVLANDLFLEFFGFESLKECQKNVGDIGSFFLPHDGFLYNDNEIDSLESLKANPQKIYHVKLQDKESNFRHFILKYQNIPEKAEHGILSFDDITELNLLKLFDNKQSIEDEKVTDYQSLYKLLSVIQRNSGTIELHNYYNGLSITNNGIIVDINDEVVSIKTSYMQQKAIQMEKQTLIQSSALPHVIECREVVKISFEKQIVELQDLRFIENSPILRETIRVVPKGTATVSLFLGENKFLGEIVLEDISLNAVRLRLNAIPAGLEVGSKVLLDIVLELDKKPLIINTEATLLKKKEFSHYFSVVFIFGKFKKSNLVKYITKRQMELIREIKGMQNG